MSVSKSSRARANRMESRKVILPVDAEPVAHREALGSKGMALI